MSLSDRVAALQIRANLIADPAIGLLNIDVRVSEGVAVLSGHVGTIEEKTAAEDLAYEAEGVIEVENHIEVRPTNSVECEGVDAHLGYGPVEGSSGDTAFGISGEYNPPGPGIATSEQFPGEFTDEEVLLEVKAKLTDQDEIDVSHITATCDNQIVVITGSVGTTDDLNALLDIVTSARGVMGVNPKVSVRKGEVGTPAE